MPDIDLDSLGQTQLLDLLHRLQQEENSLEKECKQLKVEATSLSKEYEHLLLEGSVETSKKQKEEETSFEKERNRVRSRVEVLTRAVENKEGLKNISQILDDISAETKELGGAKLLLQQLCSKQYLKQGVEDAVEINAAKKQKEREKNTVKPNIDGHSTLHRGTQLFNTGQRSMEHEVMVKSKR